jgi:hypothetical protein
LGLKLAGAGQLPQQGGSPEGQERTLSQHDILLS